MVESISSGSDKIKSLHDPANDLTMTSNSSPAFSSSPHLLSNETVPQNVQPSTLSKPWTRRNPFVYNMQSILQRGKAFLTPSGSTQSLNRNGFTTVNDARALFPPTDPAVDGEDCLHDCANCVVDLPRKWSIDEEDTLFGHVNGWESHVVVATGKNDWVRDVTDEKGSLMEKIKNVSNSGKQLEYNGRKVMLSASDMPTGNEGDGEDNHNQYPNGGQTRCLVLPSWKFVEDIKADQVEWMMREVVSKGSHNMQMVKREGALTTSTNTSEADGATLTMDALTIHDNNGIPRTLPNMELSPPEGVTMRACPHRALILMCSHKTRDWRCGASAPLLRREFERHLRPLGLYRDIHDERPGGVGIYFINHVGGHKYSANIMIYRRQGRQRNGDDDRLPTLNDEAVQGIWLARVRPEDCENIVKYTVLQGKLVKPQRQLRGGFDRESGLVSW